MGAAPVVRLRRMGSFRGRGAFRLLGAGWGQRWVQEPIHGLPDRVGMIEMDVVPGTGQDLTSSIGDSRQPLFDDRQMRGQRALPPKQGGGRTRNLPTDLLPELLRETDRARAPKARIEVKAPGPVGLCFARETNHSIRASGGEPRVVDADAVSGRFHRWERAKGAGAGLLRAEQGSQPSDLPPGGLGQCPGPVEEKKSRHEFGTSGGEHQGDGCAHGVPHQKLRCEVHARESGPKKAQVLQMVQLVKRRSAGQPGSRAVPPPIGSQEVGVGVLRDRGEASARVEITVYRERDWGACVRRTKIPDSAGETAKVERAECRLALSWPSWGRVRGRPIHEGLHPWRLDSGVRRRLFGASMGRRDACELLEPTTEVGIRHGTREARGARATGRARGRWRVRCAWRPEPDRRGSNRGPHGVRVSRAQVGTLGGSDTGRRGGR